MDPKTQGSHCKDTQEMDPEFMATATGTLQKDGRLGNPEEGL